MSESIATTWSKRPSAGSSMSPTRKSTQPRPSSARRALARERRPASARGRSRRRAAPRRAASTASAPVPQPASSSAPAGQIGRQPRRAACCAHPVAAGAHGRADAADRRVGREPRPRVDRRAVEVGLDLARGACRYEVASASVESQQVEDVAVLHRRRRRSGSVPAQSVAASRRYSCCTASSSGDGVHLEQRRLLQPAAADHVEVGEVRHRLQADARR